MNTFQAKAFACCVLVASAIFAIPAALADEVTEANLTQRIQSATTSADHEDLARYYNEQLSAAKAGLEKHLKLKEMYRHSPYANYAEPGFPSMDRHCDQLIRSDKDAVNAYSALVAQHRAWAKRVAAGAGK